MRNLFYELTLEDKKIYEQYVNHEIYPHSLYSFTTIYIWRKYFNAKFIEKDGSFIFLNEKRNGEKFCLFPVSKGDTKKAVDFILESGINEIRGVSPEMLERLKNKELFDITPMRNGFDYVYETEKLISLSGKKLHKKKNHLNKFLSVYPDYSFKIIDSSCISDCFYIMEKWFSEKYPDSGYFEREATGDILNNLDELGCKGVILYVKDKPVAFSVGENITKDTALIQIEKADTSFDGSYAMINNLMVKTLFSDTKFVNREEDMGIESIRKAKLSYKPHHFNETYCLIKKS